MSSADDRRAQVRAQHVDAMRRGSALTEQGAIPWEGDVMEKGSHPALDVPHSSLCNCQSLTAASPVGASVCPLAISESVVLGTSSLSAICAKVIPIGSRRRSAMRDCQAVDLRFAISSSIRDSVLEAQRHPVTEFRQPNGMELPPDYPKEGHLGARIKFWREFRGLSHQELGKLADVAPTTLSTIENQRQSSSTRVVQLATALQINAEYLATGQGHPYQSVQQVPPQHDWPQEFPPVSIIKPLDANERELAGMKLREIVEEIKARRSKRHRREG